MREILEKSTILRGAAALAPQPAPHPECVHAGRDLSALLAPFDEGATCKLAIEHAPAACTSPKN